MPVSFKKADIEGKICLDGATINHEISFDDATVKGNIYFRKSKINDIISLDFEKLKGKLIFEDTSFKVPWSQKIACMKARKIYEDMGDRNKANYYFYLEMKTEREEKGWLKAEEASFKTIPPKTCTLKVENLDLIKYYFKYYQIKRFLWYDVIERALMQEIFGYGVHPMRLLVSWISIVILFAFVYWAVDRMKGGIPDTQNCLESFATALAPGYIAAVINSTVHTDTAYHLLAVLETIIGTLLWAGFVATFAKRYMR